MKLDCTKRIAEQALSYRLDELPADVIYLARFSLLDNVGLAVRGVREETTRILGRELFSKDVSARDLLPGALPTEFLPRTAMLRAVSAHAIDFDDTLWGAKGAHVGSIVNGALLALAAKVDLSGADFLAAQVAGYETAARVAGLAQLAHYENGFHSTSTFGVFGVAAACAKAMGANQQQMEMALGLAATQAAGVKCTFGTMAKPFNAGNSCANGLTAASLAMQGFTAPTDALEAEKGFLDLFLGLPEAERNVEGPDKFNILELSFKYHATCNATHPMIEALRELQGEKAFDPADVKQISVKVLPIALKTASIGVPRPGHDCRCSFSQIAASVVAGLDMAADDTFSDDILKNETVNQLRERVAVIPDPKVKPYSTDVIVELTSGEVLETNYDYYAATVNGRDKLGERLGNKFNNHLQAAFTEAEIKSLSDRILAIEHSESIGEALSV